LKVDKNTVVSIHYTLTDKDGNVVDSSVGNEPLTYIHGAGGMIPGFEKALTERTVGEKFNFTVEPQDGYGTWEQDLVQRVPKSSFQNPAAVKVGVQFQANSDHGPLVVTVTEVTENEVVVDGNHMLAGQNLFFEVEVLEIRAATKEEMEHGHIHGPGCHH
jgi:FKBP-type peptidyl-prolyl cis-trans isomerase SlyD